MTEFNMTTLLQGPSLLQHPQSAQQDCYTGQLTTYNRAINKKTMHLGHGEASQRLPLEDHTAR